MSLPKELLDVLVCPETHEKLGVASAGLVTRVNEAIRAGTLRNRAGRPVTQPIEAGLVRADGKVLYRVDEEIPNLLPDEAIPLDGVE